MGINKGYVNEKIQIFVKYFTISLSVIYIFWAILTILFQVFFHYVPLPLYKLNILILSLIGLSIFIILIFPINNDLVKYIINLNRSEGEKRRLLLHNSILVSIITWLSLVVILIPFILMQLFYQNINAINILINLVYFLFVFSFLSTFSKLLGIITNYINFSTILRLTTFIFYLFLCLLIPSLTEIMIEIAKGYFYSTNKSFFIKGVLEKYNIYFNYYETNFNIQFYLVGILSIISIMAITYLLSKFIFYRRIKRKGRYIRFNLSFGFVFRQLIRKNSLIDNYFVFSFFIYFLILPIVKHTGYTKEISALIPLFLMFPLFLIDNKTNIILFLKRNNASYLVASYELLPYLYLKYFIFQFLLFLFKFQNLSLLLYSILIGFVATLIIVISFVYTVYLFEGILDPLMIYSVAKWSSTINFSVYFSILLAVKKLFNLSNIYSDILIIPLMFGALNLYIFITQKVFNRIRVKT